MQRPKPLKIDGIVAWPIQADSADAEVVHNLFAASFQNLAIRHYLPFHRFESLVTSRSLYLRRLDTYHDDPFEGHYPQANRESGGAMTDQFFASARISSSKSAMFESQSIHRRYCYIHCWFEGVIESPKMWRDYGDRGRGVSVLSSTSILHSQLSRSAADHLHIEIGRCTYRDEHEPIPELFSNSPAFRKRRCFVDEHEIRILAQYRMGRHPTDSSGILIEAPDHQHIPIDLSEACIELVTGPEMPPDTVGRVIELCSGIVPTERIRPSRIVMEENNT